MGKKKWWKVLGVAVVLGFTAAAVFLALFLKDDLNLTGNISYCDRYVLQGHSSNFSVTVRAGDAEKCFLTDGKALEVGAFCRISLSVINNVYSKAKSFDFKLLTESGDSVSGVIEKDGATLEFYGSVNIADPSKIKSVTVEYGNSRHDVITLNNLLTDRLSGAQAYEKAVSIFSREIKDNTKNGVFNREIYVKFVTGYGGEEPYYWYVAFIASDTDYWAVLLDSKTGAEEIKRA